MEKVCKFLLTPEGEVSLVNPAINNYIKNETLTLVYAGNKQRRLCSMFYSKFVESLINSHFRIIIKDTANAKSPNEEDRQALQLLDNNEADLIVHNFVPSYRYTMCVDYSPPL